MKRKLIILAGSVALTAGLIPLAASASESSVAVDLRVCVYTSDTALGPLVGDYQFCVQPYVVVTVPFTP